VAVASGTGRAWATLVPAHLPTHVRESVLSALCNYEPSIEGRGLSQGATDVNADGKNAQEPGPKPEPADPPTEVTSTAPTPAVVKAASGTTVGMLARRFKGRAMGIVGVAAVIVVGSIIGSSLLSSSNARGDNRLKTQLTASHSAAAATGATITVTGNGQVEGTPDTATFDVGVETTAANAVDALERNNAQVVLLEASLEQHGVLAKNLQTSWFNLSANTNNNNVVTGFSADDSLSVTMNNLSGLGEALDAAVHATGNGVTLNGISFSIANQSSLLATARAQAMQQASTEASQLAAGGGLAVGPIVKVTDQENAGQQIFYGPVNAAAAASSAVPVQAGQQQISVQVTVVYQLVPVSS